jgi:hypothetical protein
VCLHGQDPECAAHVSLIALTLAVLLAIPSDTPTSGMARVLVPLLAIATVTLFLLRRRAAAGEGVGLLKPGRYGKPDERVLNQMTAYVTGIYQAGIRAKGRVTPDSLVCEEFVRLNAGWSAARTGKVETFEEIRSLYQLGLYATVDGPDDKLAVYLKDVADPAPFIALRQRVQALATDRQSKQRAFEDWKASVGSTDMSHLLKSGWIPFLRSLPAPDPDLWHGVATDFHSIEARGRLDAAFWILEQSQCDKATASDFIRGFVANELLERAAEIKDMQRLTALQAVIDRYNSGFYSRFAIRPDLAGIEPIAEIIDGPFDDKAVAMMIDRIVRDTGIAPLRKPVGLLQHEDKPNASIAGTARSTYDFWDDAGLHLRYPGPDWHKTQPSRP